jgi:hypothetical protein
MIFYTIPVFIVYPGLNPFQPVPADGYVQIPVYKDFQVSAFTGEGYLVLRKNNFCKVKELSLTCTHVKKKN